MTLTFDARRLTDALVKLQAVPTQVQARAAQVTAEAQGHLILGAQANVYSTAPGAYQRTQDYLRSLSASSRTTRHTVTVTVKSDSPYALYIELGSRGGMTPERLQQLAQAAGNPEQPLSLGRSGQQWWIAGPVISSAQYFAHWRLRRVFAEEVRRALGR